MQEEAHHPSKDGMRRKRLTVRSFQKKKTVTSRYPQENLLNYSLRPIHNLPLWSFLTERAILKRITIYLDFVAD